MNTDYKLVLNKAIETAERRQGRMLEELYTHPVRPGGLFRGIGGVRVHSYAILDELRHRQAVSREDVESMLAWIEGAYESRKGRQDPADPCGHVAGMYLSAIHLLRGVLEQGEAGSVCDTTTGGMMSM